MSVFSPGDDLSLALAIAADADLVSMARFRRDDLHITTKPDSTPVTDADRAVEAAVVRVLSAARPNDHIFGEETGHSGNEQSPRQWVIDPIDGTANFLRGLPIWATLIALVVDGIPQVGVVSAPALGQRWWAAPGLGAWTRETGGEPRALQVSGVSELSDAVVSYNNLPGWLDAGYHDALMDLSQTCWRARALGDFWSYMLVAEGRIDIAGEWDLQPYDIAALWPIVTEAGGMFSSLTGDATIQAGSALATNGSLHPAVLERIRNGGTP